MKALEYLLFCFNKRCYQKKMWLLSVFTIMPYNENNTALLKKTKYALIRDKDHFYFLDDDNNKVIVEGDVDGPLFSVNAKFTLKPGDHPLIKEELLTTAGIFLLNACLIWEPFRGKAGYYNGNNFPGHLKKVIFDLMVDNPNQGVIETDIFKIVEEGAKLPEGQASVDQCLLVTRQAYYLNGLMTGLVKAASISALTVDKKIIEFRDKLLEENKDHLNDPVVVARIIDQIVDMDRKQMLSGESKTFFINDKFIENARKKMFLIFGMEKEFNGSGYKLIKNSLSEGWDPNDLTELINTAISGAYDRGKSTGLGGAGVKVLIRLTSRLRITEDDCGTKLGERVKVFKDTLSYWRNSWYRIDGSEWKILKGDESNLIGKVVEMRSPNYCLTKDGNYCSKCVGGRLAVSPDGLSVEIVRIPSSFMLIAMKANHVSMLKTIKITLR